MQCLYLLWLIRLAMFVISLFDCILCCKALVLSLFSILFDFAVPYLSSNVPFLMHAFNEVFHFHAQRHKSGKEQPKELSVLGRKLAELMKSIEDYDRSFAELKAEYRRHFSFQSKPKDNAILKNILKSRGWKEDEIGYYLIVHKNWPQGDHGFQYKSPWMIINILLARYSTLLADYKPNQIAKDIMNKLLLDIIVEHLSCIFDN